MYEYDSVVFFSSQQANNHLKKIYAIPRRKQNGGRSGKKRRPISLLGFALISKMQKFYHVVRMERIFFYVAGRDVSDEVPVCTIKKTHNICSSTMCFIEYLVANEIIDQYRYA